MNSLSRNLAPEKSVSDEEELDCDWEDDCVSLRGSTKNKNPMVFCEDDVRTMMFQNEGTRRSFPNHLFVCEPDEETVSDDEGSTMLSRIQHEEFPKVSPQNRGCDEHFGSFSWCEASKEAGELIYLNENSGRSSSVAANLKSKRVHRGKAKLRFSFRCQSRKEELYCSSHLKDGHIFPSKFHHVHDGTEQTMLKTAEHSMAELLEDIQCERTAVIETNEVPARAEVCRHGCSETSMTNLIDGLQDKTSSLNKNRKKAHSNKYKSRELGGKKIALSLGDRNIVNEDLPEPLGCETSSDDETQNQSSKPDRAKIRRQTVTDQFQQVLGDACMDDDGSLFAAPKLSGFGGRLHQIMQREKEMERNFARKLQTDDKSSCIDAMIMSKYLDAKLTVCQCTFMEYHRSQCLQNPVATRGSGGQKRTIIFNSRACGDVDLEVGDFIRIYPPWKEVLVSGKADCIILCSYFSQIRHGLKSKHSDEGEVCVVSINGRSL